MHELAVTESILDIALRHATSHSGRRITDLYLAIGELSSIIDDSVQFYWDIVSQGTAAEGATLHFRRIEAEFKCLDCEHQYKPTGDMTCPACGSKQVRISAGEEMLVESLEVED
jgi:hydrogenase nickel incorporation protein HypA/HybF